MKDAARAAGVALGLAMLVAAIDQGIKGLVRGAYAPGESHALLPGVLSLTYSQNTGAAFGLLTRAPRLVVVLINLAVTGVFVLLVRPYLSTRAGMAAAALIFGGALSNLLDRIRLGYVVDYLDIHVWPVFNIADACVVAGVAVLILAAIAADRAKSTPTSGGAG